MIYYTADLHFGHKKILKMDKRPFETIEEHDRVLIERWNARVRPEDQVYILGDFCVYSKNSPISYLEQLNGRKYLITGNHDFALVKDSEAMAKFEKVEKMLSVMDGQYRIVLCHYPIAEWERYFRGGWHIYGHIHGNRKGAFQYMRKEERALNAGIMINHYQPVTMEELISNNKAFRRGEYSRQELEWLDVLVDKVKREFLLTKSADIRVKR